MEEAEVWIAKDKSGQIYIHTDKPFKSQDCWISNGKLFIGLDKFSSIKWDDEKPTEAKIITKKRRDILND